MTGTAVARRMKQPDRAPARATEVRSLRQYLGDARLRQISRVFVIRTSSRDKRNFKAMFDAGVATMPDDPDVQQLAAIGASIVLPEGEQSRRELGAMELRRGSVAGGRGVALLGWLVPVGRTLFVLFLETARKADLPAESLDQRRNAFTEAICEIVRTLRPADLHAPILNRLVRNVRFGQQLMACLRDYKVAVWVDGAQVQLDGDNGELLSFVNSFFAARDADATVRRLAGVEALIYRDGLWYLSTRFLPFTWRARQVHEVDPLTGETRTRVPDERNLEVVPQSVAAFDRFVEMLSDRSLSLGAIGIELGGLGIRSRAPRDAGGSVLLSHLANPANGVATLIQRQWLDAWLTGKYRATVHLKADLSTSHPSLAEHVQEVVDDATGETTWMQQVEISLPLPERGHWLTREQYDRIVDVRHSPTPQRTGRAAGSRERRPLSSLSQWDDVDTGRQHRLATFDSGATYSCLWRPIDDAYDEHGASLGWTRQHRTNKLASVPAPALHASIGRQLAVLAEALEDQLAVLSRPPQRFGQPCLNDEATRRASDIRDQLDRAESRRKGIREERQIARGNGQTAEAELLASEEAEIREQITDLGKALEAAEADIELARTAPETPAVISVEADLGTLELVAAALQRCGPFAPAALNEALGRLLPNTLKVYPSPTGLSVTWRAEVELPLADGSIGRHTIASPEPVPAVAFIVRDKQAKDQAPDWDDRLAEQFFDHGTDMTALSQLRDIKGTGKADTYAVKRLRQWLREHGVVSAGLRRAALDAPPDVRRALGHVLRGRPPRDSYEQTLLDTYTPDEEWGVTWAASSHDDYRRILASLEALGPRDADAVAVARHAGLTWSRLVALTNRQQIARPRAGAVVRGPALEKNWGRGHPRRDRRVSVPQCPHADCLGRAAAGPAGLLIQLLVPELGPSALICRECRRRPDDADTVFPEIYSLHWRGGRRMRILEPSGARWVGSHCVQDSEASAA